MLTKLRGPKEQLEELVGRLNEDGDVIDSALVALMDDNVSISNFTASRAETAQKAKELRVYGYAS